ncbi:hypothetical protein ILP92_13015 [Maribius pontilimi]|uniref:Uncharacterized protein n=1 Tax=Palleronia pontilimi TaxID=1964209 RepID=A0A934IDJ6_9RHOB|nr:hypothetical protein [Palleronia pontilimi]MBJ3763671.1 hypothetical protein [Palleronia pontilimi]
MSFNMNAFATGLIVGRTQQLNQAAAMRLGILNAAVARDNSTAAIVLPLALAPRLKAMSPPPRPADNGPGDVVVTQAPTGSQPDAQMSDVIERMDRLDQGLQDVAATQETLNQRMASLEQDQKSASDSARTKK